MAHDARDTLSFAALAGVVLLGVVVAAWLAQERLIFFPQPLGSVRHLPARAAAFEVTASDGAHLRGWIVHGGAASAPAVVYFGGNAEEVSWTLADKRWPRGWAIVGVNYRGYGESEGKPGERDLTSDALAVYDAVAARNDIDPRRIVVFGRSLGSALAARVAAQRPVAAAILVSPFDSLVAVGRGHYPWLPVSLLLRHRFEAIDAARAAHVPLLAMVGDADSIIAPERSRALYDAWAGPKTWRVIVGADHNSLGADEPYWEAVARFLAQR